MATVEAAQEDAKPITAKLPRSRGLRIAWIVAFGSLALSFPIYSHLAFHSSVDRVVIANAMAVQVTLAYFIGIFAALLPIPSLRNWTRFQRVQGVVLPFVIASYTTHLTWELGWLIMHKAIAGARNAAWAYPWWNYIDGGDLRYLHAEPNFMMVEVLSVMNACVGITGLILLFRSKFTDYRGTLLVMTTAVTHTVLTWYYYGTEIMAGFPSVNTDSIMDLGVKFILLNGPWLIAPWFVLGWGYTMLKKQFALATRPSALPGK
ncbi:hypothetical protein JN086_02805 [Mycolicibacterium austroafricanum]|jgi:hypothetical protein|uniref:EXPERA domain-containing protein n=1 Tax=Mycolicibacterium austroafricanum TaxID=39687 RepID=A0ABT8HEJ8_MYCAO|nr:hypothetical protein [Mycolicibacterium austroafricanum]MDN4519189.1 hypothetical protein [Mycolicibacterium austroafricanum]PQP51687.1 hypothetical protein C6A88_07590 [Mycolicibacterium austroafricanum]QRZ07329.1 hypothetical protein JN090_01815 [Mycolicibacterium austroafricanum]QZT57419.1 hypothetical protein JN084_01995 [Mycolicibacterium austroafricanum]QZT68988.1 hypothetical protein JN086_02805 [Mycolicibacterium austroafricanum]